MHFSFIVFVITLCFSAYKASGSEPANMANPDERALRNERGEEDYKEFLKYRQARETFESTLNKDNTADHVAKRKSFETEMLNNFNKQDLDRYTKSYDDIKLARQSPPNGKQ